MRYSYVKIKKKNDIALKYALRKKPYAFISVFMFICLNKK